MNAPPRFPDRADAGRQLAAKLGHLATEQPIVLGLPRCGVPVAYEVALALRSPLDVILVRTLRTPIDRQLVGVVLDGNSPEPMLDRDRAASLGLSDEWLEAEVAMAISEIERRRQTYGGGRSPGQLFGRTVLVVDQAIRTGETMAAAVTLLDRAHPRRVVLAAPIGTVAAIARLKTMVSEVVNIEGHEVMQPLQHYYADSHQISHDEVVDCLQRSRMGLMHWR
jgi:putative phosphoribosyl transferase